VFVVNSRATAAVLGDNWLANFRDDLLLAGRDPDEIPLVFQFNRRDLPVDAPDPDQRPLPVETLEQMFKWPNCRYVPSIARQRVGVFEALGEVIDLYEDLQAERARKSPT
jgi:hypothetical protein